MDVLLAVVAGALAAALTTPAGVSGAVFLVPVQVALLGVTPAASAPTNLVYNLLTAPAGARRLRIRATAGGRAPVGPMLAGAVPGMLAGVALRGAGVVDEEALRVLIGSVIGIVGLSLLVPAPHAWRAAPPGHGLSAAIAAGSGVVGGLYGIGGGALMVPLLVGAGAVIARVAPSALACTAVTSAVGLALFQVMATAGVGVGADWALGLALGAGGVAGAVAGAALAPRLPSRVLRLLLALIALVLAVRMIAA